jgi:hypothetical protein
MKVITGRVVEGRIEVEGDLPEGTAVAVLAADEGGFQLSSSEEDELVEALAAIRSGAYVDGHSLLREIQGLSRQ